MTPLRLSEIARMTGGRLHGDDVVVDAIATDTRALPAGGAALFVALKGERFDGHDHLAANVGSVAAGLVSRVVDGALPQAVVADILVGFVDPSRVIVQRDRAAAIARAIGEARADDIVLIAGKGHEPYQEIDGVQYPFDDTEVARMQLEARAASQMDGHGSRAQAGQERP